MTQKQRILTYSDRGYTLTRLNSWKMLGILECPARICELKQDGHDIKTERLTVTNKFGEKVSIAKWRL
jgi:hypothetical protein